MIFNITINLIILSFITLASYTIAMYFGKFDYRANSQINVMMITSVHYFIS